jgi:hypothetical protein
LPLPDAAEVTVIHVSLLCALHVHPLLEMATLASPAPAPSTWSSGAIAKRQGAASCTTRTCVSLTTISPSRVAAVGLVAAVNSTLPLPCPDAGDRSETQPSGAVTVQAHSGAAVIEMVTIPPSAVICEGAERLSWHLTRLGAVGISDVLDELQPETPTAAIAKTIK